MAITQYCPLTIEEADVFHLDQLLGRCWMVQCSFVASSDTYNPATMPRRCALLVAIVMADRKVQP